jgi:FkbM family methyltransferase
MRQHFIDNGLSPDAHRLIKAAVGAEVGRARWPKIQDSSNYWGTRPARLQGEKVDDGDVNYLGGLLQEYIDVEVIDVNEILNFEPLWDLVHIDVQGWEAIICRRAAKLLKERVRYLIVGTHSRKLDGDIYDQFHQEGWILEHEKPSQMKFAPGVKELESMTLADGTQVWRNPALCL